MSRLDAISSRMSKLMLKRWTMLGEMCTKDQCSTPLMRDPETNNDKCVWHDAEELFPEEAADQGTKDPGPENTKTEAMREWSERKDEKLDSEQSEVRRRKQEQGDLASERIGKRLLQGWAMIDRSCPNQNCYSIPLVQNREKMQECVICNQQYMDEKDYVAKYGDVKGQEKRPEQQIDSQLKPDVPLVPAAASQPAASQPAASQSAAVQPAASDIPITSIHTAINALNAQIAQLSARLSAATDLEDIQRIAKTIGTCAEAISQCKQAC
ncbi:hypothetical protein H4R22_000811 [Coemansia sp. RSA 1290]|nr:hypothetical protein H4R22_000811 [Coemansia sp. RSA 1290]